MQRRIQWGGRVTALERLQKHKADAEARWQAIVDTLARRELEFVRENRSSDKDRLKAEISELKQQLGDAEREISLVERAVANYPEAEQMASDALTNERKGAIREAIAKWEQVLALGADSFDAQRQLDRLKERQSKIDTRLQLISRISVRVRDLRPIIADVIKALRDDTNEVAVAHVEQFLSGDLTPAEFIEIWQALRDGDAPATHDFAALRKRLDRGEIALFLGSDVARELDQAARGSAEVADALSAQARLSDRDGTLATVAEYFQISNRGIQSFYSSLWELLPPEVGHRLGRVLASIERPMLIVDASLDRSVEGVFARAKRRFVVVQSVVKPMVQDLSTGFVQLRFSDADDSELIRNAEELSTKKLIERGYTVIYKIRGRCPLGPPTARESSSLVLSETSLFEFARHWDKLIPNYIGGELGTRGLWFLGFSPRRWEDRLIARAVLDARCNQEPPTVVSASTDEFENAFWRSRGVGRFAMSLKEFLAALDPRAPDDGVAQAVAAAAGGVR